MFVWFYSNLISWFNIFLGSAVGTLTPNSLADFSNLSKSFFNDVTVLLAFDFSFSKESDNFFKFLSSSTNLPFTNKYGSPVTLGTDRIALISAATLNFPNRNVLVIDAGSCITYDFINSENEYLGGGISPGLHMRYKALNSFTANLPELEPKLPDNIIGNNTASSIHGGVIYGVLYEIDGFIDVYKSNYDDLTIILTGGDADFLRDSLKNDIFANSNFLFEGLNLILEHNKFWCLLD